VAKAAEAAAAQKAKVRGYVPGRRRSLYRVARTIWRNAKHRRQWANTLAEYVFPVLGNMPVADVDTGVVMGVLETIWRERLRPRPECADKRGAMVGDRPFNVSRVCHVIFYSIAV
jgi:hypothetical protein